MEKWFFQYIAFTFLSAGFYIFEAKNNTTNAAMMVAYIGSSSWGLLVTINSVIAAGLMFGLVVQTFFFGPLHNIEREQLRDKLLFYVGLKIVFIGAIVESPTLGGSISQIFVWIAWFSVLGFLKMFSLLGRERFQHLTAHEPNAPVSIHFKMIALNSIILVSTALLSIFCYYVFGDRIPVFLLMVFECFMVFLETAQTLSKYAVHLSDLYLYEGVWESRANLTYHIEFFSDILSLMAFLLHYTHILLLYGFNCSLIHAVILLHMKLIFVKLCKRVSSYFKYRRLLGDMDNRYSDVGAEELEAYDDKCPICLTGLDTGKKLPCGHIFHRTCLTSWLERHSSCPTCRMALVNNPSSVSTTPNPDQQQQRNNTMTEEQQTPQPEPPTQEQGATRNAHVSETRQRSSPNSSSPTFTPSLFSLDGLDEDFFVTDSHTNNRHHTNNNGINSNNNAKLSYDFLGAISSGPSTSNSFTLSNDLNLFGMSAEDMTSEIYVPPEWINSFRFKLDDLEMDEATEE